MRAHHNHNATKQVIATGLLALLLAVASTSGLARGLRGGGQAGALGDFDLFLQTDTTNGLPVNLVNGLEHANNTAGDALAARLILTQTNKPLTLETAARLLYCQALLMATMRHAQALPAN